MCKVIGIKLFFYRILVLAAIGLASLYMLHLLAQDYNKIRKPVMKLARFLGKRDTNTVLHRNEAKVFNLKKQIKCIHLIHSTNS